MAGAEKISMDVLLERLHAMSAASAEREKFWGKIVIGYEAQIRQLRDELRTAAQEKAFFKEVIMNLSKSVKKGRTDGKKI